MDYSFGTGIGSELCHYEFVEDSDKKINLEIHFEFSTSDDYQSVLNILNRKKLLNRPISYRFTSKNKPRQVGIIYDTFDLNDQDLVDKAIASLNKMNNEFQKELYKFILRKQRKAFKIIPDIQCRKTNFEKIIFSITTALPVIFLLFPFFQNSVITFSKNLEGLHMNPLLIVCVCSIVITSLICLTVFFTKFHKHYLSIKKLEVILKMYETGNSDDIEKSYINAVTDI